MMGKTKQSNKDAPLSYPLLVKRWARLNSKQQKTKK